jgi:LacI family transcriptional regulator
VDVDNRAGARLAVNHLIGLGRRRIATIAGPQNLAPGIDRRLGYEDALTQAGIAFDPSLVIEGDFTDEGGYGAMRELLPQRPDAVFAASDIMAIAAMRAIHEAGLKVPDDIAVVGFDDIDLAARASPTLTTIRQPVHQSGVVGAETLIQLIDAPQCAPRHIILPIELVVRASCGGAAR